MSEAHRKSDFCLNCNTGLRPDDNYCPHCGQKNTTHIIPVKHIIVETFEDFFHFDTKLWNTIKITFSRPGKITADYLEGKRARYVPPVKLYIFISFVFFLLLGKLSDHAIENNGHESGHKAVTEKSSITLGELMGEKRVYRSNDSTDLSTLEFEYFTKETLGDQLTKIKTAPDSVLNRMLLVNEFDTTRVMRDKLRSLLSKIQDPNAVLDSVKTHFQIVGKLDFKSKEEYDRFRGEVRHFSRAEVDSLLKAKGMEVNWFNRQLVKKLGKIDWRDEDDLKELSHAVLKSISLTMFVMMPLTAILLLLIFYRKKYYYEHLIFSIHTHTIFFLIFSFVLAVQIFVSESLGAKLWVGAFVASFIYLISSLKYNYRQTWRKTVFKFLLMSVPYFIIGCFLTLMAVLYGFLA
ncbi:MAG TPA: DUF3667 domain-containing protein [Prolixibacteraceae bacterium]|nr:DUF3667 domain-containing protein [Prolixibacteraceae bacterium]HPR84704.1 DUF3667 domain-containing protein [Prolixibacteraceae bacterium]